MSFSGTGSVVVIATGYGLDGPGIESRWGRDFPHPSRPALVPTPTSCTMRTGSFPGVKSGRGVRLTPHPLLVPWSRKSRSIPLLPLWAVRPVQSLSACTRVHFTYFMCPSVKLMWIALTKWNTHGLFTADSIIGSSDSQITSSPSQSAHFRLSTLKQTEKKNPQEFRPVLWVSFRSGSC